MGEDTSPNAITLEEIRNDKIKLEIVFYNEEGISRMHNFFNENEIFSCEYEKLLNILEMFSVDNE